MGPEQEGFRPSGDDIDVSRKESDKELVEGGAEWKEGKLQITKEQSDHLHKIMEAEFEAEKDKFDRVGYIKSHIESDLSFQPQIRQEVAKVMQSLLKTSKDADKEGMFLFDVIQALEFLKNNPEVIKKAGRERAWLHESWKAAGNFPNLTEEERKEIEDYLDGMIEKATAQTLEQYMAEKFGLQAEKSWDPDTQYTQEGKMFMTLLGSMNAGNLEDFTINVPRGKEKSQNEVLETIKLYYNELGYDTSESEMGDILAKKDDKELLITMSNYGHNIMVSVIDMPRW